MPPMVPQKLVPQKLVPPDQVWRHRWSPLATDGPPLENHPGSFMMVLRAAYCKIQSLAVMFQFAGFDYCTPQVASSILFHTADYACMHGFHA